MSGIFQNHTHIIINTFDLETFEENSIVIPYCAGFILNNKEYYVYYEEEKSLIIDAIKIIIENVQTNFVEFYVHNLNFDGLLILNEITKKKIKFDVKTNKTNIYFLDVFYLNKNIRFRCSYKIIPISLRRLGEIENFPKLFFPYKFVCRFNLTYIGEVPPASFWEKDDYEMFLKKNIKKNFNLKQETILYCLNDVKLILKILKKIISIINKEDAQLIIKTYSAASIAHKVFFKKYNIKKINEKLKKTDEIYIRSSYFGGRCEVFGNISNQEHIKYYDFSGMYGQCMLEKFHNGFSYYAINADFNLPGFHTIEYESKIEYLPILPVHSQTGKLLFPNGTGVGTFWFEEIKLFIEKGGKIKNRINSLIFESYEEVFTNFVENFNNLRAKGGYYKILGKLLINSLYGGMALNTNSDFTHITSSEDEYYYIIKKMNINSEYKLNNTFILIIKNDYKSKKFFNNVKKSDNLSLRNVSYSSAISSKARIKLYRAMEKVIKDGGSLLYCDTDSIFAGYSKINKNESIDEIKWLKFYKDGIFIAPKTYALKGDNDEVKIKGVTIGNISFEDIKKKFYNKENISFTDQLTFKKLNFELKQIFINKVISMNFYDKRIFSIDKRTTIPIILNF